jgi:hypothetical protein
MIVDLPVEDDRCIAIVTQDRLIAATQVDDLQPHRAQRRLAALENPLLVGPAMRNRLRDSLGDSPASFVIAACKPCDSTHLETMSPFSYQTTWVESGFVINIAQSYASLFVAIRELAIC